MTMPAIPITRVDSMGDELARWHDEIRLRAYYVFLGRGGSDGAPLQDWLRAERELSLEAAIDVREKGDWLEIAAALPDVDPMTLEVQITPEHVLLTANREAGCRAADAAAGPTNRTASVCRAIRLPAPIDPDRVKATYSHGQLRVTAAMARQLYGQFELGLPH